MTEMFLSSTIVPSHGCAKKAMLLGLSECGRAASISRKQREINTDQIRLPARHSCLARVMRAHKRHATIRLLKLEPAFVGKPLSEPSFIIIQGCSLRFRFHQSVHSAMPPGQQTRPTSSPLWICWCGFQCNIPR